MRGSDQISSMSGYNCRLVWIVGFWCVMLIDCSIIEQPFKIPFVAAVALYGNEVKPEIAIEAMKRVGERAQQALNAGEWKEFKQLIRFFACLQPLYEDDGVFALLGQLFDTVVDLQSANENDVSDVRLLINCKC
jgi:nuclear cap-binding protein subunit 1